MVSQCARRCSSLCLVSHDWLLLLQASGGLSSTTLFCSAPPWQLISFLHSSNRNVSLHVLLTCLLREPFKLEDKVQDVGAIVHLGVWLIKIQAYTSTFNSQLARVEGYKGHQLPHTCPGQPLSDPVRWDFLHLHLTGKWSQPCLLLAAVGDFDALVPSPRPDSDFTAKYSSCSCRRWPLHACTFQGSPFPSSGHCPRGWRRGGQWQHSCLLPQPAA